MATPAVDVLDGIERRRAQLQANVDKLRGALAQWATWEAEYDALKQEIRAANDPSPDQMREIARNLHGILVNEKEVLDLLGKPPKAQRNANQVIDMIARRIDYVQRSGSDVEKQLDTAEKNLAGVDVLLEPGVTNEEGLPMMDIEEELDEEGNAISSSVNQTGKDASELIDVLRKAGLHKTSSDKDNSAKVQATLEEQPRGPLPLSTSIGSHDNTSPSRSSSLSPPSVRSGTTFNTPATSSHGTSPVLEQDHVFDSVIPSSEAPPEEESAEDAELRRQMLQYSLSEVGQVVAELNLDQPTASFSDSDSDGDDYNAFDTEGEEEEDEYGRSTQSVITEEYHNQMRELEQRLGARMLENIGPRAEAETLSKHIGDIRTMRVRKDEQFDDSLQVSATSAVNKEPAKSEHKKGVRFADHVDVSEVPPNIPKTHRVPGTSPFEVAVISDSIVEHAKAPKPHVLPNPVESTAPAVPSGPAGRTLASNVIEHNPATLNPRAPDEFDPILIQREIQAHYHKARNKFIGQQGGFKPTEADEENPIVEERDGKTKKVSRFMAARLKAEGL